MGEHDSQATADIRAYDPPEIADIDTHPPKEIANLSAQDPRAIANLLLDMADHENIKITNLALQKLLYFAHGLYLKQTGKPLVSGYFEAWEHGPVHPTTYQAFKGAHASPITTRAEGKDALTGRPRKIQEPNDPFVIGLLRHVLFSYGRMSAERLVDISHVKNSPWDYIRNKSRTSVAFGHRIPDNVILERFGYHKVSVKAKPEAGGPYEDTPLE